MNKISVCIPTYECNGNGVRYLSELFNSLRSQSFQDFQIVISDHSLDNSIFEFCELQSDLEITYLRNPNDRGSNSANTNCAINNAECQIIKIMYQDDLFIDNDALKKIIASFDSGAKWLMNGFAHTSDGKSFYRPMIPKWTKETLIGRNLLGSPSCFSILKKYKQEMDENLSLLVDAELYHRLVHELGQPTIIKDILIANREHSDRISSTIQYDAQIQHPEGGWLVNRAEFEYVIKKHNYD